MTDNKALTAMFADRPQLDLGDWQRVDYDRQAADVAAIWDSEPDRTVAVELCPGNGTRYLLAVTPRAGFAEVPSPGGYGPASDGTSSRAVLLSMPDFGVSGWFEPGWSDPDWTASKLNVGPSDGWVLAAFLNCLWEQLR